MPHCKEIARYLLSNLFLSSFYTLPLCRWLTDNCYRLLHQPDAASLRYEDVADTIALAHGGQAFSSVHYEKVDIVYRTQNYQLFCNNVQVHGSDGPVSLGEKIGSVGVEAIAGNGLGAWTEATLVRLDMSLGPVGVSGGLNLDTGVGFRGGNLDVHVLGFGGKVGADGLAVDTPLAGVKCCIM